MRPGAVQPGEENPQGGLIDVYMYLTERSNEGGGRFWSVVPGEQSIQ